MRHKVVHDYLELIVIRSMALIVLILEVTGGHLPWRGCQRTAVSRSASSEPVNQYDV